MWFFRRECDREWLARVEQMSLPDNVVDGLRPQPLGERRRRVLDGEKISH